MKKLSLLSVFVILLVLYTMVTPDIILASNTGANPPEQNDSSVSQSKIKDKKPPKDKDKKDPWTNLVVKSDLIVQGTVTGKEYEVVNVGKSEKAGKQAYTIFTCVVEKVIKGDSPTKNDNT